LKSFLVVQDPNLYYPENTPADNTFGGYNVAGSNPFGTISNVITDWNLVRPPPITLYFSGSSEDAMQGFK
jgi:hypothetical protein